jgi:hypothetical protein
MMYELHRSRLHVLNFAVRRTHRRLGIGGLMMGKLAAKLTPDRANYLAHPDWTINRDAAPAPQLWAPEIATPKGLKDTASWYRAQGWM